MIGHHVPRGVYSKQGKIRSAMANCGGHNVFYLVRFVFNDSDSSSGITTLRPTYGTITICLKMNIFCFRKIDGLPAKFLSH